MSVGVNSVTLIGNLGRDPEVRYTQSGTAVCNIRLAVNERRKDGDSWKDHVEWVSVVAFGKTAENAGQYLSKGRQIYVEGRLQTREYEDKEGVRKWSTEVVANSIQFLGGGEDRGGERGERGSSGRGRPERSDRGGAAREPDAIEPGGKSPGVDDHGFIDDDLPF